MPEGHVIHRAANAQNKQLAGKELEVSSPQNRFSEGAKILSQIRCLKVEAFGKHLFYHFENAHLLHIHLGLFGRIRTHKAPAHPPKGQVRVRLIAETMVVDINGPTICEIQNIEEFQKTTRRIGPDLLRKDSDPEKFISKAQNSKRTIAALLMDQSVIAGIGNIFRSEILWRNHIHPLKRGCNLEHGEIETLWNDSKMLLSLALKSGKIMTLLNSTQTQTKERLNIYKKDVCPRCLGHVTAVVIENRNCYLCERCQT
ncbi:MAG: DNA-formamidopyrimidine glycosylase family protein [Rhodospirillaceae bacterium]